MVVLKEMQLGQTVASMLFFGPDILLLVAFYPFKFMAFRKLLLAEFPDLRLFVLVDRLIGMDRVLRIQVLHGESCMFICPDPVLFFHKIFLPVKFNNLCGEDGSLRI